MTYIPSLDRILPPPTQLHVKIKNTSAIPLRAAYLHGPYTLYVSCYPSTFDPNHKFDKLVEEGEPAYEPQLKAGGQWTATLKVPEVVRQDAGLGERKDGQPRRSFTWIIEVASQVLFSTTAAVHYELLVGRDEKSVSLGFTGVVSSAGAPGRLEDHQMGKVKANAQPKGVFTKAIRLQVDDTASLWNFPAFPEKEKERDPRSSSDKSRTEKKEEEEEDRPRKKRKKIHLVILTHGLHSNLGADMLYMKESIDAAARQAREDAKKGKREARKQQAREQNSFGRSAIDQRAASAPDLVVAPTPEFDDDKTEEAHGDNDEDSDDDDDEEQVLVRGFNGNCVRTERGIQYLGKRLAKYVLSLTYPDQPYLPVKSTITQSISRTFTGAPKPTLRDGKSPSHPGSSIAKDDNANKYNLAYQITSISFVGHSLGGLVQTYAIAYIQKHSPEFFEKIRPINFVALASPFLGLSNENPMYVKFALDFGLVGRTGQDLGLTWRAPTIARNSWGAMVGGFSSDTNKPKEQDPGAKPLLRILPTGPAHVALKRFRNRSVYSNVVNDGIVPLRTSCLLFLDWRGLGRVEKARRENGIVGTMVNWGFNEITGQNASVPRKGLFEDLFSDSGDETRSSKKSPDPGSKVPQAEASSGLDRESYDAGDEGSRRNSLIVAKTKSPEHNSSPNFWSTFTNFFRPHAASQANATPKQQKIYRRGQINNPEGYDDAPLMSEPQHDMKDDDRSSHRKLLVRGSSLYTNNSDNENLEAPPRTTVFESAGDLLNPPLPPKEFLLDPQARPRTIFHDRVYHPEDIPPPPVKRQRTFMRSRPGTNDGEIPNQAHSDLQKISSSRSNSTEQGGMRIEEKIARAYHKDMAWRKVLVRLEPDAHNNIIVRRMFANAYGWPVVKHMCDTHFGYTTAARTADEDESPVERAKPQSARAGEEGEEVNEQTQSPDETKAETESYPKRALTTDEMPDKDDKEIDTLHLRQQNIRAGRDLKPKPKPTPTPISKSTTLNPSPSNHPRTRSERRESRDQISDLVSMAPVSAQGEPSQMYSTMHSGSASAAATLHSLARRDSSRWSDRFFDSEGEDEESDDDANDLNTELQRAYDRGFLPERYSASPRSTRSLKGAKATSKSSSGHGKQSKTKSSMGTETTILPESESTGKVVATPETLSRRTSKESLVSAGYPDPQTLSLTGLGLRRSVHEIAAETIQNKDKGGTGAEEDENEGGERGGEGEHDGEMGITEQVARARSHSMGKGERPDLGDGDGGEESDGDGGENGEKKDKEKEKKRSID